MDVRLASACCRSFSCFPSSSAPQVDYVQVQSSCRGVGMASGLVMLRRISFSSAFSASRSLCLAASRQAGLKADESFRVFAKVGEETESTQDTANSSEDPGVRGKGFGAPKPVTQKMKTSAPPSSNSRRAPPQKPLIGTEVDEEMKQFETGAVAALVLLFSLIILEGIGLAASGFLPEEWDQFIVKVVYPSFTPTVGVFLAVAAAYGVWKYFGGGEKKGPSQ